MKKENLSISTHSNQMRFLKGIPQNAGMISNLVLIRLKSTQLENSQVISLSNGIKKIKNILSKFPNLIPGRHPIEIVFSSHIYAYIEVKSLSDINPVLQEIEDILGYKVIKIRPSPPFQWYNFDGNLSLGVLFADDGNCHFIPIGEKKPIQFGKTTLYKVICG
ncbi:MAG TPA: hypothetical protein ENI76_05835 [Ignavibacteria bacterium]|nr:hypothetical protein [Ignavibacteria bacterium]